MLKQDLLCNALCECCESEGEQCDLAEEPREQQTRDSSDAVNTAWRPACMHAVSTIACLHKVLTIQVMDDASD